MTKKFVKTDFKALMKK
jgi:hypothetical protein